MDLSNLWSSLFGIGRTVVNKVPVNVEADSVKDSNSETPIPQLSVEEEIEVLAAHNRWDCKRHDHRD